MEQDLVPLCFPNYGIDIQKKNEGAAREVTSHSRKDGSQSSMPYQTGILESHSSSIICSVSLQRGPSEMGGRG